jgi:hypothetical protein
MKGNPRKVLDQIGENAESAMNAVARTAAEMLKEEVVARLPTDDTFRDYRSSLEVVKIEGQPPLFAVVAKMKEVGEEDVRDELSIVYVVPTGKAPWTQSIAAHNPWPVPDLPVKIKKDEAELIVRIIRPDEMEKVKKRIAQVYGEVVESLKEAGVDVKGRHEVKMKLKIDNSFMARRTEFGLNGFSERPVWTPAVKSVIKRGEVLKRVFMQQLDVPAQTGTPSMSAQDAEEFGAFQATIKSRTGV